MKRLAFSSSHLSGDKIGFKAVSGDARREVNGRRTMIVSPKAVSDSPTSQTCLDPEASRVSFSLTKKTELILKLTFFNFWI